MIKGIAHNGKINYLTDTVSVSNIVDAIFPIGAIYTSMDSTFNPNKRFIGTFWELMEEGKFLQSANGNEVGGGVEAGLPEIDATFDAQGSGGGVATGAITITQRGYHGAGSSQSRNYANMISFKASRCSPVYGKSNTVQPPAIKVNFWLRINPLAEIENITELTIQKDANYTFSNLHKNIQWNSIIAEEDKQFVNIEISEFVEGQAQTITIKPIAANITEEKIVTIGLQPINGPTHKIKITLQP